jgi:hypothetical protein
MLFYISTFTDNRTSVGCASTALPPSRRDSSKSAAILVADSTVGISVSVIGAAGPHFPSPSLPEGERGERRQNGALFRYLPWNAGCRPFLSHSARFLDRGLLGAFGPAKSTLTNCCISDPRFDCVDICF